METLVVDDPPRTLDLAVSVEAVGAFVRGKEAVYAVRVDNVGDLAADDFVVEETLDPSLAFRGVSGAGWTVRNVVDDAESAVVTLGFEESLTSGTSSAFELMVDVGTDAPDTVPNRAQVRHPLDRNPTNDVADIATPVVGIDLALSKAPVGPFALGEQGGKFRIEVVNNGNVSADGPITVVDSLPDGLTFASGSGQDWQFEPSADSTVVTAVRTTALAAGSSSAFEAGVGRGRERDVHGRQRRSLVDPG